MQLHCLIGCSIVISNVSESKLMSNMIPVKIMHLSSISTFVGFAQVVDKSTTVPRNYSLPEMYNGTISCGLCFQLHLEGNNKHAVNVFSLRINPQSFNLFLFVVTCVQIGSHRKCTIFICILVTSTRSRSCSIFRGISLFNYYIRFICSSCCIFR